MLRNVSTIIIVGILLAEFRMIIKNQL